MAVEDVWRSYRRWSVVSRSRRRQLSQARAVNLLLVLSGAVAGALAAQDQWFSKSVTLVLGALGAAVLALAAVLQGQLLTRARVEQRLKARATAESFQALTYLYLVGAPPFASPDRDSVLSAKQSEVEGFADDVLSLVAGVQPDDKPLPDTRTVETYLTERAKRQQAWHDTNAGSHRKQGDQWRYASIVATCLAAVIGAVGGALHGPDLSAWVAVFATAATAFTAHLASEQHDRIATSYARTASRLAALIRDYEAGAPTPERGQAFASDVEAVLAEQNDAWIEIFRT